MPRERGLSSGWSRQERGQVNLPTTSRLTRRTVKRHKIMIAPNINPYNWLSEAHESLKIRRPDAPLLPEVVLPLADEARPFSLPPYTMSDPPFRGYLFESEPAVTNLDEYHQPFPVIALQFPILDVGRRMPTVAIISHDEKAEELLITQANKLPGRSAWTWVPVGLNVVIKGPLDLNRLEIRPHFFSELPFSPDKIQIAVNGMHSSVMAAYELAVLLQCQNISIVHVEKPKKINEKRRRKGKRPLPSGYVICVTRDVTRREYDQVENDPEHSRNKPRTHFRRGHIRRLQSGARVWVSPAMVNPGTTPLNSKCQILF